MKVKDLMRVVSTVCYITVEQDVTTRKKSKVYDNKDAYILSDEFVKERDYTVLTLSSKGPFHLDICIMNMEESK